jgi:hypothetical protein
VFGAGAALSAGAAAAIATPVEEAAPARRLALAGAVLETALKHTMESKLGELGRPYKEGPASRYGQMAHGFIGSGAAILATRGRKSRPAAVLGGALLLAGALSARFSVFKAGFQSAADPAYVVGPQRRAIEAGTRAGAARTSAQLSVADPRRGSPATAQPVG